MRTFIAASTLAVVLLLPANASAASVRECGSVGAGGYNITARNVSCSYARSYARNSDGRRTHRGYRCTTRSRNVGPASEFHDLYEIDNRCIRGSRVIRWQFTAG